MLATKAAIVMLREASRFPLRETLRFAQGDNALLILMVNIHYRPLEKAGNDMQKKKTFSTMEIVLLAVLIGSLILSFLQARREEAGKDK
jgi:hypothetical protein